MENREGEEKYANFPAELLSSHKQYADGLFIERLFLRIGDENRK
jgi:hypothetical protein